MYGGAVYWDAQYTGAQSESATPENAEENEPGHVPEAVPAMLEGYASTRPPRTEQ